MFRRRPNLIVPIRDRRQHKRYLTLKNFGIATLVFVVAFVVISIRSEMRGRVQGDYGRLFRSEIPAPVKPRPVEVVREAPVPVADQTHADPMLVQPAVRAQWLQDQTAAAATVEPLTPVVTSATAVPGRGDVAVVGGPDGVTIVRRDRRKPVLSGGFGR